MTLAVAWNTWRECLRRPFAYVAVAGLVALALASAVLGVFAFGSAAPEVLNLALSTVFMAALIVAAFLGTGLIRADLERGTFLLTMSQPVGLVAYLGGRFLGLLAVNAFVCGLTASGLVAVLAGLGGDADGPLLPGAFVLGLGRALLALPVLSAAALALSALTGRIFAPMLLLALVVAGDTLGSNPVGRLLPAFGLFGLEAPRSPPIGWLALYSALHSVVFLVTAYLRLTLRAPIRTES
jgi:ABC-type transport system involved in multi-copper enzyme maturation permease subunit